MQLLKVTCVVIPFMLLLLVASTSAVVYDDEGKVITEDEIKNEIQKHSIRLGHCCMGVGCFGGLYMALPMGEYKSPLYIQVIGVTIIALGYIAGKYVDRSDAIYRIKERRRAQKQNEDKESLVPESRITLTLLSGSF
jgi:hypothetical protein